MCFVPSFFVCFIPFLLLTYSKSMEVDKNNVEEHTTAVFLPFQNHCHRHKCKAITNPDKESKLMHLLFSFFLFFCFCITPVGLFSSSLHSVKRVLSLLVSYEPPSQSNHYSSVRSRSPPATVSQSATCPSQQLPFVQ